MTFTHMDPWYFEIFALVAAVCLAFMFFERRRVRGHIDALEQSANFIGNGLILFDRRDRLVAANAQACDFLPDLLGKKSIGQSPFSKQSLKTFLDYFYDHAVECDESLVKMLDRSAEHRNTLGFREIITASENRLCLVEAQKIPKGGTNLILFDVGDMRYQEELVLRLNQFNHELNQAIQATKSGVFITKTHVDGGQNTAFVNKAFCDVFDISRDDIIGQDMTAFFARIIKDDDVLQRIRQIGIEGENGNVEVRLKHPEEGERWYDLQLTPVNDYEGHSELFIGIINDMTELKIRQSESSKAQKLEALGQLSAGVAHDFNNILSIIDGYGRMAGTLLEGDPRGTEYIQRIRTSAQRGTNLIRHMLTFSRHEIVDDTVIDLGHALREQEALLQPLLDASIKFKILTDREPMFVECPPDNITQIMMNLVVNARDAMASGGTIIIESRICPPETLPEVLKGRTKEDGTDMVYASLVVSDTGMGMPDDVLERIFDPFFTTKEQGKGTGLGLSMVYGLMKQIGGYIDVSSTLGQGTTFKAYFPVTDKTPKQIIGSVKDTGNLRFDGFTALVAEDEPDLLELVCHMLEDLGMNVIRASNGDEALVLQDDLDTTIDLLLTDVVMPDLNGVDLAGLIKELRPETRIIFMSGYPDKGFMARVEIPEDAVFIPKPINQDNLIKIVYDKLHASDDVAKSEIQMSRWINKSTSDDNEELAQ